MLGKNRKQRKNIIATIVLGALYLTLLSIKVIDFRYLQFEKNKVGTSYIYICISLLILYLFSKTYKNEKIGFPQNSMRIGFRGALYSLIFGFLSIIIELIALFIKGDNPKLIFHPTLFSFSTYRMSGSLINQVILIMIYAIILVVVEEGLFRGALFFHFEKCASFNISAIVSSVMYIIWIILPNIVIFFMGDKNLKDFILEMSILTLTSGILSLKWILERKLTNSLWFPAGDHFIYILIILLFKLNSNSHWFLTKDIGIATYAILSCIPILLVYKNRNHPQIVKVIDYIRK